MLRSAASKVLWVGRATVFLIGLAVILALVLGAATTALGATGGSFILGKGNTATTPTSLVSTLADAAKSALIVNNKSGGAALDLRVHAGKPPMKVNSSGKVANLNADKLDGKSDTHFYAAGSKVADSDKLDGLDSQQVMQSSTYLKSQNLSITNGGGDSVLLYCDSPKDRVLSGGFSAHALNKVTSNQPYINPNDSQGQGWGVTVVDGDPNDGFAGPATAYVVCADMSP